MKKFKQGDAPDLRAALVACEDYEHVEEAVAHGLALLDGFEALRPGNRYLLKPNLLLGDKPERGSTTHPEFFSGVAKLFKSQGLHLAYGDSPGFGSPHNAARASGLAQIAELLEINLADFVNGSNVPNPEGILIKHFHLAHGLMDLDGVINLPKFKTHGLMRMTGAVKNLFGCLPGHQKAAFHARLQDEGRFGQMLVDLAELIAPPLHIMDAVWGMEGNGPRNGTPRKVGLVLISANPYAMDHCAARLMDLDPMLVPTLKAAFDRGLYQPEAVQILGERLESHVMTDFQVNRSQASTTGSGRFYMDVFKNWVTPHPVVVSENCTHCGRCVQVCPATPKAIEFSNGRKQPPQYDYSQCIRCYCCQEMCPEEAIVIQTPIIGRLLDQLNI